MGVPLGAAEAKEEQIHVMRSSIATARAKEEEEDEDERAI